MNGSLRYPSRSPSPSFPTALAKLSRRDEYRKVRSQRLTRWERWLAGGIWAYRATKVATVAVVSLSALPLSSAIAADASTKLSVDIAPQSLESALLELSKQGRLQLVIATNSLPEKMSAALRGSMPLGVAFDHLLKDTGLTYRLVGNHTIAIVKAPGPPRQLSEPPVLPGVAGITSSGSAQRDDKVAWQAKTDNSNMGDHPVNQRSAAVATCNVFGPLHFGRGTRVRAGRTGGVASIGRSCRHCAQD